jgi:hypothetical protein
MACSFLHGSFTPHVFNFIIEVKGAASSGISVVCSILHGPFRLKGTKKSAGTEKALPTKIQEEPFW